MALGEVSVQLVGTRDGAFQIDSQGQVVTATGYQSTTLSSIAVSLGTPDVDRAVQLVATPTKPGKGHGYAHGHGNGHGHGHGHDKHHDKNDKHHDKHDKDRDKGKSGDKGHR